MRYGYTTILPGKKIEIYRSKHQIKVEEKNYDEATSHFDSIIYR